MVLANPEIARLPNWVVALIAAGALAAYNTIRPHSSLGYKPPAPLAVLPSYEKEVVLKNIH